MLRKRGSTARASTRNKASLFQRNPLAQLPRQLCTSGFRARIAKAVIRKQSIHKNTLITLLKERRKDVDGYMTMTANGLAKLSEELGELQQVVGKMLAYGTGPHPDGTESLLAKFEEEAADVCAAVTFVSQTHGADPDRIRVRAALKLDRFQKWHADPNA